MEIVAENVDYQYQRTATMVLKNVNLKIEPSTIVGIVGKSGSGKTTLLEMMNALRVPTDGYIEVGKKYKICKQVSIPNVNELRFDVGLVFQFPEEQFFSLTVQEELELPLKFYHYNPDKINKRILDVLKMLNLDVSILNENPHQLSNGEKRKIALASILVLNPSVLVLDEPTIGLDYESKKNLWTLFRLLKKRYHKTIIIASHDTEFLHKLVDYIYVLDHQKIVLEGNKYDVFKQEKLLKKCGIQVPKVIAFENRVLDKKNIKIGYRDEINDLIKDIYRYVR